jgi:hypothetical protein
MIEWLKNNEFEKIWKEAVWRSALMNLDGPISWLEFEPRAPWIQC